MRDGDYTLIARRTGELFYPGLPVDHARCFAEITNCKPRSYELYDVVADPGQHTDRKQQHKVIVDRMTEALHLHWARVGQDLVDWGR